MVMSPSIDMEAIADCMAAFRLEASELSAAAAVGSLLHAIVTGGADGVSIGTMDTVGFEVTEDCAWTMALRGLRAMRAVRRVVERISVYLKTTLAVVVKVECCDVVSVSRLCNREEGMR